MNLLQTALSFAARGWHVVPLHNPTPTGCSCGKTECGNSSGKHPRLPRWQDAATTDPATIRKWWTTWPLANIGVMLGPKSGIIDIECDSPKAEAELVPLLDGVNPPTFRGARGLHRLFRWQEGLPDKAAYHVGAIEVRTGNGKAAQSVFPPSVHRTGAIYAWQNDGDPPPLPAALLARIQVQQPPPVPPAAPFTPPPPTDLTERARAYLKTIEPAVSGEKGSIPTFRAACKLVLGFNMTPDQAYPLLTEWSETCIPPWTEEQLRHKLADANKEPGERGYLLDDRPADAPDVNLGPLLASLSLDRPPFQPTPYIEPTHLYDMPGFVGELAQHIRDVSPYPSHPLSFAFALACLAVLTGRKVRTETNIRTNIYLIALAASGHGKNDPRLVTQELLIHAGLHSSLGQGFASGEALEDALAQTPAMLFLTTEIADHLEAAIKSKKQSGNMMLHYLLTFYSNAAAQHPMRKKAAAPRRKDQPPAPSTIDQPHLVLIGDAVTEHFYALATEALRTIGLMPRMLVIQAGTRAYGRDPSGSPIPASVIETANWWSRYNPTGNDLEYEHPTPRIVHPTDSARATLASLRRHWDDEYNRTQLQGDNARAAVYARIHEHVCRLSLLYACSVNQAQSTIDDDAVGWAIAFVDHCTERMLTAIDQHAAENPFDASCQKFLTKLRDAGGVNTRSILLRQMKIPATDVDKIINTLRQRGEISEGSITTAGRSATAYSLISPSFTLSSPIAGEERNT